MRDQEVEEVIDDCCSRFEAQLRNEGSADIAAYLDQVDKQVQPLLFRELLLLEIELLSRQQFTANASRYREQFAEFDDTIREVISAADTGQIQALSRRRNPKDATLADEAFNTVPLPGVPALKADSGSPVDSGETEIPHSSGKLPPHQVGNYRLRHVIGEGGMGRVWMAEQEKPVRRQVALKIIKAGLDSQEVIARFEAERQALAIMDHPNIARILDAGTTEHGQPYFAMELVKGVPLTEYCDAHKLNLTQRLQLFIKVCDAVQHAHQKGIIHRDLKPSNVLVVEYNGQPVPKVIDFGLAKALEASHRLTDKSLFTEFGQVLGTLKYMSPEQAGLNSLDIDTRSDIYALGVILYELLTGTTPLDSDSLKGQPLLSVLERIREQESPRPSSRLATAKKDILDAVTDKRCLDARKLGAILQGDLDWIVLKAIEKDRNRRYESPTAFAQDIQHYLDNEPVTARPPSLTYKAGKFIQKNRGFVTAVALTLSALLLGMTGTIWFALDANASKTVAQVEADRAKKNEQLAVDNRREALDAIDDFFLTVSEEDLLNTPGLQPLRLQLLAKATSYYEKLLADTRDEASTGAADSMAVRLDTKVRYARMLSALGQVEKAQELFKEAVAETQAFEFSEDSENGQFETIASSYLGLAKSYLKQKRFAECEEICEQSLEKFDLWSHYATSRNAKEGYVDLLITYGFVLGQQGRVADAKAQLQQAKDTIESLQGDVNDEGLLDRKADTYSHLADLTTRVDSIPLRETVVDVRRELSHLKSEDLYSRAALGKALQDLAWAVRPDTPQRSLDLFTEAAEIQDALQQANPTVTDYRLQSAKTADLHAYTLHQIGVQEADPTLQRQKFNDSLSLYKKGESLLVTSNAGGREAIFSRLNPAERSLLAMIYNGQALVHRDLKDLDSAVDRFNCAFRVQMEMVQASPEVVSLHRDAAGTQHNLGRTYAAFNEYAKAVDACFKANELQQQTHQKFPEAKELLADLANSQTEMNSALLMSGDVERIKSYYKPAGPMWKYAASELNEASAMAASEMFARIDDSLIEAMLGDVEPIHAMLEQIYKVGDSNPQVYIRVAAGLSVAVESLLNQQLVPQPRIDQLVEIGKDLLQRLEASGAASREEIEAEPTLKRLLNYEAS